MSWWKVVTNTLMAESSSDPLAIILPVSGQEHHRSRIHYSMLVSRTSQVLPLRSLRGVQGALAVRRTTGLDAGSVDDRHVCW